MRYKTYFICIYLTLALESETEKKVLAMEFIKQKTECVICFKTYEEPHILPCLHSFCLACLKSTFKGATIDCPLCNQKSCFNDIHTDFNLKEMVDFRLKSEQSEEQINTGTTLKVS